MTSFVPPKKGAAFITYIELTSQSNTKVMQSNPTIAAGDFKLSIDGGALANLATLPTVTPAGSKMVKISLSASEMDGDNIHIVCSDAAGAEWCDLGINIQTSARQVDDLAYPATSGRSTDIDSSGRVLLQPTQTGVTIPTVTTVGTATNVTTVNGLAANVITTAAINDGALTDAKFAVGAFAKVWSYTTRKLTDLSLTLLSDLTTALALTNTTIKTLIDPIEAEATLGDGAITSATITPAAIAQLASLPGDNSRTFTRGDDWSFSLATLGHTWGSGATMRFTMKPLSSYAKDADNAATVGILLTTPAASSADGLVVLNKITKSSAEDRALASLTHDSGSQTSGTVKAAATQHVQPGQYKVDIQVVEADGDVVTIVPTETWTIEADVTRATS